MRVDGRLQHELGFAGLRPRGSAFRRALDEALQQMQEFLELQHAQLLHIRASYFGGCADWFSLVGGTIPFSRR